MNLTVHIPDDAVPALKAGARDIPLQTFAEQVLLERIHEEGTQGPDLSVADAARRLGTFGKRHGLSLGGMTIRELLNKQLGGPWRGNPKAELVQARFGS